MTGRPLDQIFSDANTAIRPQPGDDHEHVVHVPF